MKRKVYVETTVASYLTARPSRDPILAVHQQITAEWWAQDRHRYHLFISDLVLREAARGDELAADRRLAELAGIQVLALDDIARDLARLFLTRKLIPEKPLKTLFM